MDLWMLVLWVHLLAVIAWVGGMIFLTLILVPVERGIKDQKLRYEILNKVGRRFKYLGWGCIVILLITGTFSAIQKIGSSDVLFHTGYGKTFLLKLFLVSIIIILSAIHDFYLGPRLVYNAKAENKPTHVLTSILILLARGNLLLVLAVIFLGLSLRWGGIF